MVSIRKTKKTFTTAHRKMLDLQLAEKGAKSEKPFASSREGKLFKTAADADHKLRKTGIRMRDSEKVLKTIAKKKTAEAQAISKNKSITEKERASAMESALAAKEYAARKLRER